MSQKKKDDHKKKENFLLNSAPEKKKQKELRGCYFFYSFIYFSISDVTQKWEVKNEGRIKKQFRKN